MAGQDYHERVPSADDASNTYMRDVVGNKSDTTGGTSLVSMLRQWISGSGPYP